MPLLNGVNFDSEIGVVTQVDGDTGDSAQRTATLVILSMLLENGSAGPGLVYQRMLTVLKVGRGRFTRSPLPSHWGSDPTNFSRDQHSMLMLAMAIMGDKKELKETFMEIVKRGGFHQNFLRGTDDIERRWKCPDIIAPTQLSVMIRGLNLKLLYPILTLLDLGFLLDLIFRKNKPWDYDNMLAPNLMFAAVVMPTFVSRFACRKYGETDFIARVKNYHDPVSGNGIAGMGELFEKAFSTTRRFL